MILIICFQKMSHELLQKLKHYVLASVTEFISIGLSILNSVLYRHQRVGLSNQFCKTKCYVLIKNSTC